MQAPLFAADRAGIQGDFYLLVLAGVYHADGLWGEATYDLYARSLAKGASHLVVGGVEEAIDSAISLRFSSEELEWLRGQKAFAHAAEGWWSSLEHMRFEGDIHAMPEGTIAFPHEPVLRVTAPLVQATLVHTRLVQALQAGTGIATHASRLVQAAGGRRCFEFASRSLPSQEAGLLAARAAAVGGFEGSSNSLASAAVGMEPMGTLSEDFYAVYPSVASALEAFSVHFPQVGFVNLPSGTLRSSIQELAQHRELIRIVRLDHSRLGAVAGKVRAALDAAGMEHTKVLGTGSLTEEKLRALGDAPIDMLGMGKSLTRAMHSVPFHYRIAEIWRGPDPEPCAAHGASVWPGVKQVWRYRDHDVVAPVDEDSHYDHGAQPLLRAVVREGERLLPRPAVQESAERCRDDFAALQDLLPGWSVKVSPRLQPSE